MPETALKSRYFVVVNIQATAFIADRTLSAARVMACVLRRYANRYDGDPQALPLPPDVPPEIPRVILQSSDSQFRFESSPSRISSHWVRIAEDDKSLADVATECAEVIVYCLAELKPRCERLALVATRAADCEHPPRTLIERFCKTEAHIEPLNRSATFELHNHKQYEPDHLGVMVNSWVRCKTGTRSDNQTSVVIVEQDINTLAGDANQHRFDSASAQRFFTTVAEEADDILRKYFPEKIA